MSEYRVSETGVHTRRQRSGLTYHKDLAWAKQRSGAKAGEAARSRGSQGGGQLGQETFMLKGEGKVSSQGEAHLRMFIYLWTGRVDVSGQRASCGLEIEDTKEKEGDEGRGRALG